MCKISDKVIKIGDREITLRELTFEDSLILSDIKDQKESARKVIELATTLTEEERKKLTLREGLQLIKEINEFNGLTEDFLSSFQPK